MTKVSPSHRLANRAILAVCAILDEAGALAEPIKNDYGEDLLVQTQLKDVADDFHVLIQVKGKSLSRRADGSYRINIDAEHIRRWAYHALPVLVCVYDEISRKVFAFSIRQRFSLWHLAMSKNKYFSISFDEEDLFNAKTALNYIWSCRVDYFARMISWYSDNIRYTFEHDDKYIEKELNVVLFMFIKSLFEFGDNGFSEEVKISVKNCSINLAKENSSNDKKNNLGIEHVFSLCLLGKFDELAEGVGLTLNLIEQGGRVFGALFRHYHPTEWAEASQNFKGKFGKENEKGPKRGRSSLQL